MVNLNIELPEGFFDEEERNGYLVTKKKKEVWAIELDLLVTLIEVCHNENLEIYIDAGSLLGAVRHKGFIPWDDDIDMVMFRQDYDRLVDESSKLFHSPYFLQTTYTDDGYARGHAQFRNSDTTAILKSEEGKKIRYNQGIFLDIFVLDGVCGNGDKLKEQRNKIEWLNRLINISLDYYIDKAMPENSVKARMGSRILSLMGLDYRKLFTMKEDLLRSCNVNDCENVAPLSFKYEIEKRIRNKHIYDNIIWLDFENIKVPAPAGYDQFLSRRYGNYMAPAQIPNTHGDVFFDTGKSYIEYRGA